MPSSPAQVNGPSPLKHSPGEVSTRQESRHLAFDAVRIWATIAVVMTHAAVPYMKAPPPSLVWPVADPDGGSSRFGDFIFLWGRTAAVAAFFVLAGYFAADACARSGWRAFIGQRLRRIGVPLAGATLTVLVLTYPIWAWGWVKRGWVDVAHAARFSYPGFLKLGFAHLWFLEYLLIYCVAYALWLAVMKAARRDENQDAGSRDWLRLGIGVMLSIVGLGVCVWLDPSMPTDFRNGFVPRWAFLAYNAILFAMGVRVWMRPRGLTWMQRLWLPAIIAANGTFAWWMVYTGSRPAPAVIGPGVKPVEIPITAPTWETILPGAFAVLSVVGWVGMFLFLAARIRLTGAVERVVTTLSKASYGIYIVHLPLVCAAQVATYKMQIPAEVKCLLSGLAGTVGGWLVVRAWDSLSRR
jgi:peptidoglycan/LPS O-acetylase OafA/YrhL